MPAPYTAVLHRAVAEQILQSPRLERQRILAFLERLEDDPNLPGDYTEFDQTGRSNQVLLLGRWAVTYWCGASGLAAGLVAD